LLKSSNCCPNRRKAGKTLRNIRSLYIKEFTAEVDNGKISNYRINAKVSFDLESERVT